MNNSLWVRSVLVGLALGLVMLSGCPGPIDKNEKQESAKAKGNADEPKTAAKAKEKDTPPPAPARTSTASAEDVAAAKSLLDGMGSDASYSVVPDGVMTDIVIKNGFGLTADDIALFGRLTDLSTLQIMNYRDLDDDMVTKLSELKQLRSLAITNATLGDTGVETIVESFPELTSLDLSSNANMTNSVFKVICKLSKLENLVLVQTGFNDLATGHLDLLENLKSIDMRGNMEAGDMTMEMFGLLPKLESLKHRSSTVADDGLELLAETKTLEKLMMQDFRITDDSAPSLAKLTNLTELEIFRCARVGDGAVLALKGLPLTRLRLRDLPAVKDPALEVFSDLPQLERLYLHELDSISDEGLKNLASLKGLRVLDIWSIDQMSDATIDVIGTLPRLTELSIRLTGVTDESIDKLLAMKSVKKLTFKDNPSVSPEALKKLADGKWASSDISK